MIITALATRAEVEQVRLVLERVRAGQDLAVGVGSTVWPSEYNALPAFIVSATPGGYYIAQDAQPVMYMGYVRRLVEMDGDRVGFCPGYASDTVLWVEQALDAAGVIAMRRAALPEEIASLTVAVRAEREAHMQYDPFAFHDEYWQLKRTDWLVSLQMHDEGEGGRRVPDCWLVAPPGGQLTTFWSGRYWQQREEFRARYDWTKPGLLEYLTDGDANHHPYTRTQLYPVRARTAVEAVEAVRERILVEQGLPA